ncbi:MAG: beta-lactamase family protein [Candidatus Eremiobacteraeota bacterium]|nr:beta-lactamase family protein [Candidatus Eremiobacteraeota bacterium]MBC5828453.1 beta-lactamase family protein [Candidatus Eremiobacteraeota bacterium]
MVARSGNGPGRTVKVAALTAICVAALSGCQGSSGLPGPAVSPSPPSSKQSAIDAIVEQNYAGSWGVELGIYKNGRPLYVQGYGWRDRGLPDSFGGHDFWGVTQPDKLFNLPRGKFAPDANTIFDLASISKEFTAGAILLLQQDGKLSVNDPLSKFFPAFPNGNAIPLLYLLQHRSGLVDYNSFGQYPDFSGAYTAFVAGGQTNYQPIVDTLATFPLKFAPGSAYDYSNSNYLLLGIIVAQVSGEPLGTFLQQRIFGPLGMSQTHQSFSPPPQTDVALGYANYGAGAQRTWQPNLQWLAGPGGLTSTVGDLEKWDRAVRSPGIFTQAALSQMFAPSPYPQSYGTYADGWFISSLSGHLYIWHDGALTGYQTMNATFPNDGIDIIVLTDDGSGLDPYYMIPQLFQQALTLAATH